MGHCSGSVMAGLFLADDTVSIVWVGSSSALIVDTILLGLILTGRPVVGVRFLVCGEWQIWMRMNTDISLFWN